MNVLFRDDWLVVAVKPPGVPSQPDLTGDEDFLSLLRKAENSPLWLVHRLDRPVGGVMVFGKSEAAAAALSAAFAEKAAEKRYLAVCCGDAPEAGTLRDYLLKNTRLNTSSVVTDANIKGAKQAVLRYQKLKSVQTPEGRTLSLLHVCLETGRHHQIRVQLAHAGLPLWGDTKYNPAFSRPGQFVQLGLWAFGLRFKHPKTGKALSFEAPPPEGHVPFNVFRTVAN